MTFKKVLSYLELEGQGRGIIMEVTRPLLLGACQPKHFGRQCTYENGGSIYESLVKKTHFNIHKVAKSNFTNFQFKNLKFFHPNENQAQKMGHEWHSD